MKNKNKNNRIFEENIRYCESKGAIVIQVASDDTDIVHKAFTDYLKERYGIDVKLIPYKPTLDC